nr:hypothetical protein [Tanacetum cinerariifolium]
MNMSLENKAHFQAEKEAIHLILTGIGDEIYSTSRFVTIVNQQHKLDEVSYHKLFDILKQYQKEVNELCIERLARNANPLALVATAQANQEPYYQTSKSHKSYAPSSKPSIPTRSHTTTRHKGKEIAKPITPPSEIASEEDSDPEQAQRDKDMQKNLALIAKYFKKIYKPTNNNFRTSSKSRNKNVDTTLRYKNDNQSGQFGNQRMVNVAGARKNVGSPIVQQSGIQCLNCKEFGHFAKECIKPKRVKDSAYHTEKMLLCKQAEQGVPLQAEQYDWVAGTDEEVDEQELEAHYNYMAKIQEVLTAETSTDSVPVEQNDQTDVESDDERVTLANLIANLKLDTKQTEFEKYKAFNDHTIDYDKLKLVKEKHDELMKQSLLTKSHYEGLVRQKTKQEMHADLKYIESLKKEIDKLEYDKAEFSNIYDVILQECVSKDVMCSYLMSLSDLDALDKLQCFYLHKVKECDCLVQKLSKQTESVSKKVYTELLQHFAKVEKHSISLEVALQKYLKAQLQDKNIAISELKKLIEKGKGKSVDTKFDKPSVVRQPNAQQIPKPSVLGVNHKTNVSRPHHKSTQLKNKVLPNNSQMKLKKTQVEVHPRIPSVSNKMKSVTTCKDNLNSRTLNANAICATCNKCLVDSNHFARVTKMLNDVNARTKKPNVVPISTRKPKSQANKSVATPHKKKVASKSNNQKPQSYYKMLYEKTKSTSSTPLCLMAKALPTQAWLWHRRLSPLNFNYINLLSKKDIVISIPVTPPNWPAAEYWVRGVLLHGSTTQ